MGSDEDAMPSMMFSIERKLCVSSIKESEGRLKKFTSFMEQDSASRTVTVILEGVSLT